MKNVIQKVLGAMVCFSVIIASASVNSTCFHMLYQEKLSDELDQLRKLK